MPTLAHGHVESAPYTKMFTSFTLVPCSPVFGENEAVSSGSKSEELTEWWRLQPGVLTGPRPPPARPRGRCGTVMGTHCTRCPAWTRGGPGQGGVNPDALSPCPLRADSPEEKRGLGGPGRASPAIRCPLRQLCPPSREAQDAGPPAFVHSSAKWTCLVLDTSGSPPSAKKGGRVRAVFLLLGV